ncbi:hypothetical protein RIU80_17370 [Salmonella enterica subsp. enterica serovar Gatineau]|uniref:hypothetical protein n=1 Tax=Salmonella enterica TaxID=28901 RepID=UPI0028656FAC|nr:hypothetical protein [Salmonella enterica]MDR7957511.1 hypothetical protein [Salmonella enterica subsp. enterica serovar Gatineau]MDR7966869.1 hypothetical protein [Salmonella enterica subsp. enterica serovar Gatineau]MDR7971427.1 hypothetical protein [Salmonella enterica subsp. enterica serovar Gatineau]
MRTKIMLLSALVAICFSVQAKPTGITVQDVKHLALKQCLVDNYHKRTPPDVFYAPGHDMSFLVKTYALDNAGKWKPFLKFVAKETEGFDRLTMALHPDSAKDANNVLERCMAFYESGKLDKYVRETVMK